MASAICRFGNEPAVDQVDLNATPPFVRTFAPGASATPLPRAPHRDNRSYGYFAAAAAE